MERIIKELKEGAGKQFDPEVVKVMLELIEENVFYGIGKEDNEE